MGNAGITAAGNRNFGSASCASLAAGLLVPAGCGCDLLAVPTGLFGRAGSKLVRRSVTFFEVDSELKLVW
jgi:hypothetical protein